MDRPGDADPDRRELGCSDRRVGGACRVAGASARDRCRHIASVDRSTRDPCRAATAATRHRGGPVCGRYAARGRDWAGPEPGSTRNRGCLARTSSSGRGRDPKADGGRRCPPRYRGPAAARDRRPCPRHRSIGRIRPGPDAGRPRRAERSWSMGRLWDCGYLFPRTGAGAATHVGRRSTRGGRLRNNGRREASCSSWCQIASSKRCRCRSNSIV